ncbi:Spy/CpxP family protein refolding chaperone [Anaerobaca lacustris]|uniref:Periplasmic heavy metal sensor n=1 Tax=Anaerobaca lacustris TaxID=3044600 RepID=A0AAW6U5Z7_9BACT|nr:periplasmic heavy metal sensor [Sedimentisphaerales bacterium M17dextr]
MVWKKIAPLVVVFSVALNIALIGTWAARAARVQHASDEAYAGEVWCPLHRRLGVSPEQWRRIEPQLDAFRRESQALRAEMNLLRAQLVDLIAGDRPDHETITATQEEIRARQRRMQELVVEHLLAEKETLTAEQQRELFDMIRRRSGCQGPALMWGNAGETSQEEP